ncbi:hypothetical protein DFH06DRAFT_1224290 [Mycena polygramma]|nr:hypothetical protein DFH06DRAFT_1224290 [Mycena polygramma]
MSNSTLTDPNTDPPTILLPDPATAIGPIFLGNALNWMLMGFLLVQVYIYWLNYSRDQFKIKFLVYTICLLDIIQTAFGTHEAWWYSVGNWGVVEALQEGTWTSVLSPILCGIISAMVQIFYAMRIWLLKRSTLPRLLACLIVLLALAQSLTAIIACSLLQTDLTQANLLRLHPAFSFWLAGSFATDILVAASMTWILYSAKPTHPALAAQNTDGMLNRLIVNTIQTGTVTVLCAGIALALFIKYTDKNYYFALTYVLGKLYSNSFMATLNQRAPHRPQSAPSGESIGMRIQVSRRTDKTVNGLKLDSQWNNGTTTDFAAEDPTDDLTGGQASSKANVHDISV